MRTHLLTVTMICACALFAQAATYPVEALLAQRVGGEPVLSGKLAGWQTLQAPDFDGYRMLWGTPVSLGDALDPQVIGEAVQRELGTAVPLQFRQRNTTPTRDYLIYRELRDNLPVVSGRTDVVLNKFDQVTRISQTSFAKWPAIGAFTLTKYVAGMHLSRGLEAADWQIADEQSFPCWYPDVESHELRAAYWLRIAGPRPHQRYNGIVDAETGAVLLQWSGIAHEVLDLSVTQPEWPMYEHEEPVSAPCAHQNVDVNAAQHVTSGTGGLSVEAGTQADVVATLVGTYVEVTNDDNGEQAIHGVHYDAPFNDEQFAWPLEQASPAEYNLYYHTTFIHDWYKVIDPSYNALDYAMPAVANYGSAYDNAFWNGFGTYYGSGLNYNNFGMYSDVIYHEYTHGATDGIYPDDMLPYVSQPGAMNEAWSDYFGCTINGDALMGEWLTGSAHQALRNLESIMVFPRNWTGEVHSDSPFISAPLWRLRGQLGIGYTDSLAHYARYALAELFFDYFVSVLETDDTDGNLANGTPHGEQIYASFGIHGIGPGTAPNFMIENLDISDESGNNNGYAEAGEGLLLSFRLVNDVLLFPPAATGVVLTLTTDDPTLVIDNGEYVVGSLGPREQFELGPVQIAVMPNATDHWGVLHLEVHADQLVEPLYVPIEFTVGLPKLRVVTRSLESDVHEYVTTALRDMDKIYEFERIAEGDALDLSALPDTGLVIWLSGDATQSHLSSPDIAQLDDLLASGGHVVLSGKNILAGTNMTFAAQALGVEPQGYTRLRMASALIDPFVEGATYLLTGSGGAANQDSMTKLTPLAGATPVLRYGPAGTSYAGVVGPNGRTLTLGFGMEAIADNDPIGNESRTEFLAHVLAWAGLPTSAAEDGRLQPLQPTAFDLHTAYPNPFNSSVRIHYSVGQATQAALVIYNVLGREVHRAALSNGMGEYSWQPLQSSGVYFAVLQSDQRSSRPLKLLLVR